MSALLIRKALEVALAAMTPSMAIAYENQNFTPVVGAPYQQIALLLAEPDNSLVGRAGMYRQDGFLQVDLKYPLDGAPGSIGGTEPATTRAELIRSTFYRGASFTASGVTVNIERTPEIMPARVEEDRFVIPVRVRFYAFIPGV
jgi:hypothetical protein